MNPAAGSTHPVPHRIPMPETRLSNVDGLAGELTLRGIPVQELAGRVEYEEAAYLLWHGALPGATQLACLRSALVRLRQLPPATLDLLAIAASEEMSAMDALCIAAGTLGMRAPDEPAEPNYADAGFDRDSLAVVARIPTAVAAYWRLLQRQPPIPPDPALGHAANYLAMIDGRPPSLARVRALETYLVALIDHGMNASTFAARVIQSTGSDLTAAVAGAVGALKGPLHGGAPGPALQAVLEIRSPEQAEPYLRAKLERGERLMGFGHRDYKVRDPRTAVLSSAAQQVFRAEGGMAIFELARHVERTAVRLLADYKPGRDLYANVEFYAGLLMHGVGLPPALFTPTFAVARAAGWVAHCAEQRQQNRLLQPQTVYTGPAGRHWTPIEQRPDQPHDDDCVDA